MKINYKDCPEDIKELVVTPVGSTESEYRIYLVNQPEEKLKKAVRYLKNRNINITKRKAIEKELERRGKAIIVQKTSKDFVMSNGKRFSKEWTDMQTTVRRRHEREKIQIV